MKSTDQELEELEIRLMLEAIHERYGYDFRGYALESMRRRVHVALGNAGAAHLGELQHRLIREPGLFFELLDDLTVQVSEMFRDPHFYRAFRRDVVPVLRTYPQIKIWHAGCASGEEVYATAILLAEEDLYERAQLYATDVSTSALDKAREGIYAEAALENSKKSYLEAGGTSQFDDYYSTAYGKSVLHEELKKNIVFFQHDLASDYAFGEMNVIFCRNVLIYFADPLRNRVLGTFARGLCRGGFFCLGRTERVPLTALRTFSEFSPDHRIYRHRGET
jgi:chemotaxis protein methyltransferase CheR